MRLIGCEKRIGLIIFLLVGIVVADTWIWSEPTGYSPQPRFEHTTTRINNQLFVFGGTVSNGIRERDVHVFNMDTTRWSSPEVSGNQPGPTMGHQAVSWKNELIVLFGSNGKTTTNRVYRLDTDSFEWKREVPIGRLPTPRTYHSSVIVDDEVFVFGGYDGKFYLNDLHRWKIFDHSLNRTGAWEKLNPTGNIPQIRSSAATAVHGRRMFMFGGFEVTIYVNDFFALDLDKLIWSRIHLSSKTSCEMPGPRAMTSLTLVGTNLVLFGGIYCSSDKNCTQLNDVHQYRILTSEWVSSPAEGTLPPSRYGHSATLFGSKVAVFGGASWPNLYNDIFYYDVYENKWTIGKGIPPYPIKQHSLNLFNLPNGSPQLAVFGGKHGSEGYSSDLHLFDIQTSTWTHPSISEPSPPAIGHHTTRVKGTTLYVFGGYNGKTSSNTLYSCDLTTLAWEKVDVEGDIPPPSHGHSVVEGEGYWYQFGGVDCSEHGNNEGKTCEFFSDTYSLNQLTLSWKKEYIIGTNIPTPRASHSWTSLSTKKHYLFGGITTNFTNFNDLYVFDSENKFWNFINISDISKPSARFDHAAVSYKGKILIFGGGNCQSIGNCEYFNDVYMFDPIYLKWTNIVIEGDSPQGRLGAAMQVYGEKFFIHGGATNDRIFGDLITIEPDQTVIDNTIIYGSGKDNGVVGKNIKFFIQLQDSFHVNRTTGGDLIEVNVKPSSRMSFILNPNPIKVLVQSFENGIYKVEYTTPIADIYKVNITINKKQFPLLLTNIIADIPNPNNSKAIGNGLIECIAGLKCEFKIDLIDSLGNKIRQQSPVDVQFIGPYVVAKNITTLDSDGTVVVNYIPQKSGDYKIHITVRTIDIHSSPFNLTVKPSNASSTLSKAEGEGLSHSQAGDLGFVRLTLIDSFGNYLRTGGDDVRAQLTGPDDLICSVQDFNNGTYLITYTAVIIGQYKLQLSINNQSIIKSPFEVIVTNAPLSPATTFAYGDGLRQSIAGYRSFFTIQSADAFGNNITKGGNKFNILFAGPGEMKQVCNVVDHQNGKYTVSYINNIAGDFVISATYSASSEIGYQSIHLSPFLGRTVAAGPDPNKSYIFVEDKKSQLKSSSIIFKTVAGIHNYFKIQALDRYGNRLTVGGDHSFSSSLEGPVTIDGYVSDNGDGTYVGTYAAPLPGVYLLRVFYAGIPLQGTPFQVKVRSNFDTCLNDCSNHGDCVNNECVCYSGYIGIDCSVARGECPSNCMGNGTCVNNTCFCYPGFAGSSCEITTSKCLNDCSNHGTCVNKICTCEEGYSGTDCSDNSNTCINKCSGNGECVSGSCLCYPGYSGISCSKKVMFCPKGCSGRGKCMSSGICSCFDGWTGLECNDSILIKKNRNLKMSQQVLPVSRLSLIPNGNNENYENYENKLTELSVRLTRK